MSCYVYILKSEIDGSLYTGQTEDIPKRLSLHNKGRVKSTKLKAPYKLAYYERFESRSEAMWREWELKKRWNKERKEKLLRAFPASSIKEILAP